MSQTELPKLIDFLHLNLNLPDDYVQLALKKSQPNYSNLPVIMWQYGLVNLPELDKIYDWFESYVY
jgi:hypothetical protein